MNVRIVWLSSLQRKDLLWHIMSGEYLDGWMIVLIDANIMINCSLKDTWFDVQIRFNWQINSITVKSEENRNEVWHCMWKKNREQSYHYFRLKCNTSKLYDVNTLRTSYLLLNVFVHSVDNHTKIIVGTAVAVGTLTAAGLAYLYTKRIDEPIPTKWDHLWSSESRMTCILLQYFFINMFFTAGKNQFPCHVFACSQIRNILIMFMIPFYLSVPESPLQFPV